MLYIFLETIIEKQKLLQFEEPQQRKRAIPILSKYFSENTI